MIQPSYWSQIKAARGRSASVWRASSSSAATSLPAGSTRRTARLQRVELGRGADERRRALHRQPRAELLPASSRAGPGEPARRCSARPCRRRKRLLPPSPVSSPATPTTPALVERPRRRGAVEAQALSSRRRDGGACASAKHSFIICASRAACPATPRVPNLPEAFMVLSYTASVDAASSLLGRRCRGMDEWSHGCSRSAARMTPR